MPTPMVEIALLTPKSNNAEVQHFFMMISRMEQEKRKLQVRYKKVSTYDGVEQWVVLEVEKR